MLTCCYGVKKWKQYLVQLHVKTKWREKKQPPFYFHHIEIDCTDVHYNGQVLSDKCWGQFSSSSSSSTSPFSPSFVCSFWGFPEHILCLHLTLSPYLLYSHSNSNVLFQNVHKSSLMPFLLLWEKLHLQNPLLNICSIASQHSLTLSQKLEQARIRNCQKVSFRSTQNMKPTLLSNSDWELVVQEWSLVT